MLGRGPQRSWFLRSIHRTGIALFFGMLAIAAFGIAGATPVLAGKPTIVLLDASNSMNSSLGGVHRIDGVKQAISDTAPRYDTTLDLGLVVFGSRQKQSCRDIQTLVPPAAGNASKMVIAANGVKAQGVSMLAQGLQRAAADADYRKGATSIIAIVDGAGVDACRLDTCATAASLKKEGRGLTVHVIAIVPKKAEVPLLECVASATGGTYVAVANAKQIRIALDLALRAATTDVTAPSTASTAPTPKPKPRPLIHVASAPTPLVKPDPDSPDPVFPDTDQRGATPDEPGAAPGENGNTVSVFAPTRPQGSETEPVLPPGQSAEKSGVDNQVVMAPSTKIAARPDEKSDTTVVAPAPKATEPGTTVLYKRPLAGADKNPATSTVASTTKTPALSETATEPAGSSPTDANSLTIVSASQAIAAKPDTATTPQSTTTPKPDQAAIQPETQPADLTGNGAVRLSAIIVAGAKPVPEGMMWQIFSLAQNGDRGELAARSSDPMPVLNLPAGPYMAEGRFGSALRSVPFVVKPDEETAAELILDVGGLQLVPAVAGSADANADITNTIYAADDTGSPIIDNAVAGAVIYLSAGRYRIVSRYGNANSVAEDEIQIQRGKLTQAKINHRAAPISFRLVEAAGGDPLSGVSWEITDAAGTPVKTSDDIAPTYVLVEGPYQINASFSGKTFSRSITVQQGVAASVEIIAK